MEAIVLIAMHEWFIPKVPEEYFKRQTSTPIFLAKVQNAIPWVNCHRTNSPYSNLKYFKERRHHLFNMLKSGFTSLGNNRNINTGQYESTTFMEENAREREISAMKMVEHKKKLSVYTKSMLSLLVLKEGVEEEGEDIQLVESVVEKDIPLVKAMEMETTSVSVV